MSNTPSVRKIRLTGVRQNNLKSVSVEFPFRKLSVVTGLSGSGKSSLAFDTLYAEGQRRYIESLSTYTRQFLEKMPKPELERIENIPPAIALEQRNHVVNSRSTVGTQTEIVDYLRVIFAKVGQTRCVNCGGEVRKIDPQSILEAGLNWFPGKKGAVAAPLQPSGSTQADTGSKSGGRKKKKKKKKTTKASKAKSAKSPDGIPMDSYFRVLIEQGYRRLIWKKKSRSSVAHEVIDLEEIGTPEFPRIPYSEIVNGNLFVVVDRLRIVRDAGGPDDETRARLLDSIEQAVAIGRGQVAFHDFDTGEWKAFDCRFACVDCGTEHRVPEPNLFSFNSPIGACPKCSGFGYTLDLDESIVVPDPSKTLKNGAIDPLSKPSLEDWQKEMFRFAERHGISIGKRYRELTASQKKLLWEGAPAGSGEKGFPGILGCFDDLARYKYKLHVRVFIRRYQSQTICRLCEGSRLNPAALAVKVGGRSISEVLGTPISDALVFFRSLELSAHDRKIAEEGLNQVERRLHFLEAVGVGYLTLSRLAKTLSGGEFQRINLATQLGNGLCGTLYVLDEPSIGLHAADTERLIGVLQDLRDQGNTLVVVEHDLDVMKAADWLVELGPGAGRRGGEVIAQGTHADLAAEKGSVTGKYISGAFSIERTRPVRGTPRRWIKLTGCRENNLQNISVEFPLDRFVVVTGVSGSGKSTLVHKTLFHALGRVHGGLAAGAGGGAFDRLYGAEQITGVVLLDQRPIGKSSRSNPATYLKAWDEIRRIYANQVLSLRRGYTPQYFSFNVDGGRCPVCKGEGEITLDMHFMAEVKLPCEECGGKRFKKNVLDVEYRGKNVHELLNTTIDEAYDLFRDNPVLVRKLGLLRDVGLGYLLLGQAGTTLSGGESQRLKIASALDDRMNDHTLYIFDEPTTGLHQEDIKKLMEVVHDLVESRHSVIMIEHHLDVIAQSDWVIDLGPGGGENGGALVGAGPPWKLMDEPDSATGRMLRKGGYRFEHVEREREISL